MSIRLGWKSKSQKTVMPLTSITKLPEYLGQVLPGYFWLIVLNLAITLPLAWMLNIWSDEAYTLNTTSQGVYYAIHQAIVFEEQAPFYFVVLSLWRILHSSIFFARLLSILCISLTIYLSFQISKTLFKNIHPGWLAAAIAFHPYVIYTAVEVRLYAFSLLLAALLWYFFLRGYWSENSQARDRWLYGGVALLALYTHYFLGFILVANGLTLLWHPNRAMLWRYLLSFGLVLLCFLPLAWMVFQQIASQSDNPPAATGYYSVPLLNGIAGSVAAFLRYLIPSPHVGETSSNLWRILRVGFLAVLVGLALKHRQRLPLSALATLGVTLVLTILLFLTFFKFNSIQLRHSGILLLPALFSVAAVLSGIQMPWRKPAIAVLFSVLFFFYTLSLSVTYSPLAKWGDYIRVANYLMDYEQPNQPILVFNPETEMSLRHYYRGVNSLVALPKAEDFQSYRWEDFTLSNQQDIENAIAEVESDREIWLVMDTNLPEAIPAYRHSYQVLDKFVSAFYNQVSQKKFYGSTVQFLIKK